MLSACRLVGALLAAATSTASSGLESLSLSEAYRLALKRSEAVMLADQATRDAVVRSNDVWTELGAQASVFGEGALQRAFANTDGTVARPGAAVLAGGNLVQPVFRGDFFSTRRSALLGVSSSEVAAVRAREQLMQNVITAFIGVLRARQQTELIKVAEKRAEAAYQFAAARVKGGGALRTAELQAAIDLRGTRLALVASARDLRVAEETLAFLIGPMPPRRLNLPPPPQIPTLAQALNLAQEKRRDLISLRLKTLSARAFNDAASARFWPRLDISADGIVRAPSGSLIFPSADWHLIALLTVPLFQGGTEYVESQRRESALVAAELTESLQTKVVKDEVLRAYPRLEAANRTAALAEEQVSDATQHYGLVVSQFKLGAVTFLEVANAQNLLSTAESQRAVAIYDREQAMYDFLFVIGILEL
jgi:outer membrane protein